MLSFFYVFNVNVGVLYLLVEWDCLVESVFVFIYFFNMWNIFNFFCGDGEKKEGLFLFLKSNFF